VKADIAATPVTLHSLTGADLLGSLTGRSSGA
jgi:hypothetical protein